MAFGVVNYAKFSSLFNLIGQINTKLDHLAPLDSINLQKFTQKFRHSDTLKNVKSFPVNKDNFCFSAT